MSSRSRCTQRWLAATLIWLSTTNPSRCKKNYLRMMNMRKKNYSETDVAYIAKIDKVDQLRLWRMFHHEERWADTQCGIVAADHIIDVAGATETWPLLMMLSDVLAPINSISLSINAE